VAKPEWGTKRTCQSCGARFYDLMHSPIVCPKCGSTVEAELPFKSRRQSAAVEKVAAVKPAPVAVEEEPLEDTDADAESPETADDEETEVDAIDGGDDDESGLIEDASDLGEDDDDMAEVMEHLDEDLENEL
jgi:uncharacterized protein (TIGR02300 family)